MTQAQLFSHLATGSQSVRSLHPVRGADSPAGRVMSVYFVGALVIVTVHFPGLKWDLSFFENEEVTSTKGIHYLKELEPYVL